MSLDKSTSVGSFSVKQLEMCLADKHRHGGGSV